MLEIILTIVFCWLLFKALGLALKVTWGLTKFIASFLFTVAIPMLIGCLVFTGGLLILVPLGMVALAFGLLKACV